jgi:hypothetical protein
MRGETKRGRERARERARGRDRERKRERENVCAELEQAGLECPRMHLKLLQRILERRRILLHSEFRV